MNPSGEAKRSSTPARTGRWTLAALAAVHALGCAPARPLSDAERLAEVDRMADALTERFPAVETVTVDEVARLLEKDSVVLIDAREPREREVSRIPGAIAPDEFEAAPERYADVAAVAYCTIGHRSSEYAERLTAAGHPVRNLRGSILAWAHAGGPLVGPEGPTRRLHVYGRDWDLAPESYETIY